VLQEHPIVVQDHVGELGEHVGDVRDQPRGMGDQPLEIQHHCSVVGERPDVVAESVDVVAVARGGARNPLDRSSGHARVVSDHAVVVSGLVREVVDPGDTGNVRHDFKHLPESDRAEGARALAERAGSALQMRCVSPCGGRWRH
jgi:hypothetical protein